MIGNTPQFGAFGTPGVSTLHGSVSTNYRDHFPAILTSAFATSTGYAWARLFLDRGVSSPSIVEAEVTDAGQYAFTPDNNESLPVGTRGYIIAEPNGGGWIFLATGEGGSGGGCTTGCGSLVGITTTACLKLSLVCHTGEFTDIDEDQFAAVFAFGSGGTWTFKTWDDATEAWIDFVFDWIGGTGTPVFTFDADGNSVLTIGAGNVLKRRCDEHDATFEGGRQNGFTGDAADLPTDFCDPNTFVLKVECSCCPIDGWQGDGWYCVIGTGSTCPDSQNTCVELLEADGDHCNADITICSGPYSESECEMVCLAVGPPDPTCQGHAFTNATATITNKTGNCSCLADSLTRASQGTDAATFGIESPCTTGTITLSCSGGNYVLAVSGTQDSKTLVGSSTSPFALVYDVDMSSSGTNPCTGTFRVTITDPP